MKIAIVLLLLVIAVIYQWIYPKYSIYIDLKRRNSKFALKNGKPVRVKHTHEMKAVDGKFIR